MQNGVAPVRRASQDATLPEVARALGISRGTAWVWAIRGAIPARMCGGRFLVSRRALRRLVARRWSQREPNHTA